MLLDINGGVGWDVLSLDGVVNNTITWTGMIGAFLASSFMCLKLAYEYWRYSLGSLQGNSTNYIWDWNEVVRVLLLVAIIGMYKPIAVAITGGISYINSITERDSGVRDKLEFAANKWYYNSVNAENADRRKMLSALKNQYRKSGNQIMEKVVSNEIATVDNEAFDHMNGTPEGSDVAHSEVRENMIDAASDPYSAEGMSLGLTLGFSGLALLISSCIKWAVGTFYGVLFKVALCFGPIVLAFGIFFRDKPINYFNYVMNLGFTFTTINIIDMILMQFMHDSFNNPSVKESIAFNMAIIGCYWSVGKITKWFIGETGINGIMARGMQTATSVVVGGLTVAGVAATGGAAAGAAGRSGGNGASATGSIINGASKGANQAGNNRVD